MGRSDTPVPLTWSEEKNVKWKTPVIFGNQIWLTTATPDAKELSAVAVDRLTGKILHDLKLFQVEKPQFIHPFNSRRHPRRHSSAGAPT
jgi:outer membrane protein assembly factor BamB